MPTARLASTGAVCQGGRVDNSAPPRVAVIGGGIAGLAAAFFLREEPVSVTPETYQEEVTRLVAKYT